MNALDEIKIGLTTATRSINLLARYPRLGYYLGSVLLMQILLTSLTSTVSLNVNYTDFGSLLLNAWRLSPNWVQSIWSTVLIYIISCVTTLAVMALSLDASYFLLNKRIESKKIFHHIFSKLHLACGWAFIETCKELILKSITNKPLEFVSWLLFIVLTLFVVPLITLESNSLKNALFLSFFFVKKNTLTIISGLMWLITLASMIWAPFNFVARYDGIRNPVSSILLVTIMLTIAYGAYSVYIIFATRLYQKIKNIR